MKRIILYAILILAGYLLQVFESPLFSFLGTAPNYLLLIVFSFGFMKGKRAGMTAGLFAGFLLDLSHGSPVGFYALIYMLLGYLNGICHKYYYAEYIHLPLTLCIFNELALGLYIYVFRFLLRGRLDFSLYLIKIIIPELVFTLVITLLFYRLLLYVNRRIEEKEKERDSFV